MIDIHSHFLPALDDGAKNIEESIQMLSSAFSQGVKISVATPHCVIHEQQMITRFLKKRKESYIQLMHSMKIDNTSHPVILLGAELYLDNDISQYEDIEKLCMSKSRCMLVELQRDKQNKQSAEWIYNLSLKNIKPIVAHVERYPNWKELLNELNGVDVAYQINAENFLSIYGRRFIKNFLEYRPYFIVGSDMHNTTTRPCDIQPAYQMAEKKYGRFARKVFFDYSKQLLLDVANK